MATGKEKSGEGMKKFLSRHWKMSIFMIGGVALAAIVAFFVFLWVVAETQSAGLVPTVLGQWTVGYFITFILHVIFWELVFVATWALPIIAVIYGLWYKKLPAKEREEYKGGRRGKTAGEGGGFSFAVWLIWLVIVWFDGRWNLAFQSWAFDELVYSYVAACLVVLLPCCIGGLMYLIWLMRKGSKK